MPGRLVDGTPPSRPAATRGAAPRVHRSFTIYDETQRARCGPVAISPASTLYPRQPEKRIRGPRRDDLAAKYATRPTTLPHTRPGLRRAREALKRANGEDSTTCCCIAALSRAPERLAYGAEKTAPVHPLDSYQTPTGPYRLLHQLPDARNTRGGRRRQSIYVAWLRPAVEPSYFKGFPGACWCAWRRTTVDPAILDVAKIVISATRAYLKTLPLSPGRQLVTVVAPPTARRGRWLVRELARRSGQWAYDGTHRSWSAPPPVLAAFEYSCGLAVPYRVGGRVTSTSGAKNDLMASAVDRDRDDD